MIKKSFKISDKEIAFECRIENHLTSKSGGNLKGIIDTGASLVFIDQRLADELNLMYLGDCDITVPGGECKGYLYLANLLVENERFDETIVGSIEHLGEKVLIGLSILRQGETNISPNSGYINFQFNKVTENPN